MNMQRLNLQRKNLMKGTENLVSQKLVDYLKLSTKSHEKEETTIPEKVLEILEDFRELIADELPNDLPPMRDKAGEYKADKALYQDKNSGSSFSEVEETDVEGLASCRKKRASTNPAY
ncbi:hypothetical protein A2U01_0009011 [Trifolium medium]|uniref:Uncharacterized protein n=1 Tax=Trifolium medium TaxID=97028 RepID=A0A392MKW6_9FABA|nr:hypothetical protein [Trifolium medium]